MVICFDPLHPFPDVYVFFANNCKLAKLLSLRSTAISYCFRILPGFFETQSNFDRFSLNFSGNANFCSFFCSIFLRSALTFERSPVDFMLTRNSRAYWLPHCCRLLPIIGDIRIVGQSLLEDVNSYDAVLVLFFDVGIRLSGNDSVIKSPFFVGEINGLNLFFTFVDTGENICGLFTELKRNSLTRFSARFLFRDALDFFALSKNMGNPSVRLTPEPRVLGAADRAYERSFRAHRFSITCNQSPPLGMVISILISMYDNHLFTSVLIFYEIALLLFLHAFSHFSSLIYS
jgi:hypothetical protein